MEYCKPAIIGSHPAVPAIQSTHVKDISQLSDNSPLPPNDMATDPAYEADE
jgi:hypothetical protein